MNKKNAFLTSLATAAATSAVLVGIGTGTATAAPTLIGNAGGAADVQLGSTAVLPAQESWTCAVLQGLNLGFESGSVDTVTKFQVNPMIGDWKTGPVSGYCLGSQGFTPVPGALAQ